MRKIRKRDSVVAQMFDVLPPPDPKIVSREIRLGLRQIIPEHGMLSLPSEEQLKNLVQLVQSYRQIGKRSRRAPNYRIWGEMGYRWPKSHIDEYVGNLINLAYKYRGRSVRAEMWSRCVFEPKYRRLNKRKADFHYLIQITSNKGHAAPNDLELLAPFISSPLRRLYDMLQEWGANVNGVPLGSERVALRRILVEVFQESLHQEVQRERTAATATRYVTDFVLTVGTPEEKMRIRGFNDHGITLWRRYEVRKKTARRRKKAKLKPINSRYFLSAEGVTRLDACR